MNIGPLDNEPEMVPLRESSNCFGKKQGKKKSLRWASLSLGKSGYWGDIEAVWFARGD